MNDTIVNYEHSKAWMVRGISKLAAIIKPTYGPGGANVILQDNLYPYHRVTNDGKLIADAVVLSHPIEKIGSDILKEAADKAQKESGDGRKTTIILADAIIAEGMQVKDISPLQLKSEMDACLPILMDNFTKHTKQITTKQVGAIATLASESEIIGEQIGKIYEDIGKEGIIEVETATTAETSYSVSEGYRVRNATPLLFSFFEQNQAGTWEDKQKTSIDAPAVVIIRDALSNPDQLEYVFKTLKNNKISNVVIFFDTIEGRVPDLLAKLHVSGAFRICAIKAPTLWKDWYFEDLAKLTGATAINRMVGKSFKEFQFTDLGTCAQVSINKEGEARFIGTKDITDHLEALKSHDTEENKLRASFLQTKVAILKIGANSESELSYYMKKASDGCSAAYWALQEGVVKGAGRALKVAAQALPKTTGGTLLAKALAVPEAVIIENLGADVDVVNDAAVVVKNAVKNAISIAGIVLTANGVIPFKNEAAL